MFTVFLLLELLGDGILIYIGLQFALAFGYLGLQIYRNHQEIRSSERGDPYLELWNSGRALGIAERDIFPPHIAEKIRRGEK